MKKICLVSLVACLVLCSSVFLVGCGSTSNDTLRIYNGSFSVQVIEIEKVNDFIIGNDYVFRYNNGVAFGTLVVINGSTFTFEHKTHERIQTSFTTADVQQGNVFGTIYDAHAENTIVPLIIVGVLILFAIAICVVIAFSIRKKVSRTKRGKICWAATLSCILVGLLSLLTYLVIDTTRPLRANFDLIKGKPESSGGGGISFDISWDWVGAIAVVGSLLLLLVIYLNNYTKNQFNTLYYFKVESKDDERTEKQKQLFYNSTRYKTWQDKIQQKRKRNKVSVISSMVCAIVSACVAFTPVPATSIIGLVAILVLMFIVSRPYPLLEQANDLEIMSTCDKCAGDLEFFWDRATFDSEKVEYETITLKEGQKPQLAEYDEITSTNVINKRVSVNKFGVETDGYNRGEIHHIENRTEYIYTIKRVSYWYNVPTKCASCDEESTALKKGSRPKQTQQASVTVHIENYHEVKKDLPHIFCVHCGGKNKGENTTCEHCGAGLLKPK
jgi:major membrane immunogen (membrane-anchored lipoprotein)